MVYDRALLFPSDAHSQDTDMDKAPQVKLHSTSHYFLEALNEIGVEHLFCNLGTDHAPLIEEMA
ncbi:MAG: hypothetical protein HYU75_05240, partial [Betaproteobacteria bacterium]|nr:hypothetical protein [Betaproteobacteria bacterium]